MKYKLERIRNKSQFKPFSLTIIFESEEEYTHFHNNVMSLITRKSVHPFHGNVFRMGQNEIDSAEGKI